MNSNAMFQIAATNAYGPPGLVHPLLKENYDWVDQLLCEKYYGYALTTENIDEYLEAGLLTEYYAWVDQKLEEMCAYDEEKCSLLMMAPVNWANYRGDAKLECIEEENNDNLLFQSPFQKFYFHVVSEDEEYCDSCSVTVALSEITYEENYSQISDEYESDSEKSVDTGSWYSAVRPLSSNSSSVTV